ARKASPPSSKNATLRGWGKAFLATDFTDEKKDWVRMDANSRRYIEAALTRRIIGAFYETYNLLGHGFLEGVYENALALEMEAQGIGFVRQASLEVRFKGKCVGIFRADFLVE